MRFVIALLTLLNSASALASDQFSYEEAKKEFASENKLIGSAELIKELPEARGDQVAQEKFLNNPLSLKSEAESLFAQGDENAIAPEAQAGGLLKETHKLKSQFLIDENDEIIRHGDQVMQRGVAGLNTTEELQNTVGEQVTLHTCEEPKADISQKCVIERTISVKPEKATRRLSIRVFSRKNLQAFSKNVITGQSAGVFPKRSAITINNPLPANSYKEIVGIKLVQPVAFVSLSPTGDLEVTPAGRRKKVRIDSEVLVDVTFVLPITEKHLVETIVDGCAQAKEQNKQTNCSYASETIVEQGPKTIEGVTLHRSWWKKERNYTCKSLSKDTCGPYRQNGCTQVDSQCKSWAGETCLEYTQTFECRGASDLKISSDKGPTPFCLDGNCDKHGWAPNKDFADAVSRLAILKEMQGQFSVKDPTVFRGEEQKCRKDCAGIRDCCGKGKGWGNNLGFKCNGEEKQLAERRGENKCHYVGKYCAKKELGICIQHKHTYCCFGSKLVRAVQEQGRDQLGLGWGTPKHPACRGMTIQEIQRVDFSKLDLSEVYQEIRSKSKVPNTDKITTELQHSLSTKGRNFQKMLNAETNSNQEPGGKKDEPIM